MNTTPGTITATRTLGLTDEQTTCDRCGRVELRSTVILGDDDRNEVARVGTSCASAILGKRVTRSGAWQVEAYRRQSIRSDYAAAKRAAAEGDVRLARVLFRDAARLALHPAEVADIARAVEALEAEVSA